MSGGTISYNSASSNYGGGVYGTSSTIKISGGVIHHNLGSVGGGVYAGSSTITFTGGTIRQNTSPGNGGGVAFTGTMTMNGADALIAGNESSGSGGGVRVGADATFTFKKGIMRKNTAATHGGISKASSGTVNVSSATNGAYVCANNKPTNDYVNMTSSQIGYESTCNP